MKLHEFTNGLYPRRYAPGRGSPHLRGPARVWHRRLGKGAWRRLAASGWPDERRLVDVNYALKLGKEASVPRHPACLIERAVDNALSAARAEMDQVFDGRLRELTLSDLDTAVTQLHAASPHLKETLS